MDDWNKFSEVKPFVGRQCEYYKLGIQVAGPYQLSYSQYYTHWKPWAPSAPPNSEIQKFVEDFLKQKNIYETFGGQLADLLKQWEELKNKTT